jgi:hypothetical protein
MQVLLPGHLVCQAGRAGCAVNIPCLPSCIFKCQNAIVCCCQRLSFQVSPAAMVRQHAHVAGSSQHRCKRRCQASEDARQACSVLCQTFTRQFSCISQCVNALACCCSSSYDTVGAMFDNRHFKAHLEQCSTSTRALPAAASTDASAAAMPPSIPGMPCRLCSQHNRPTLLLWKCLHALVCCCQRLTVQASPAAVVRQHAGIAGSSKHRSQRRCLAS